MVKPSAYNAWCVSRNRYQFPYLTEIELRLASHCDQNTAGYVIDALPGMTS